MPVVKTNAQYEKEDADECRQPKSSEKRAHESEIERVLLAKVIAHFFQRLKLEYVAKRGPIFLQERARVIFALFVCARKFLEIRLEIFEVPLAVLLVFRP